MDSAALDPENTDAQLLAAAASGAHEAFHDLVDRHAERLFRLACRLVGNKADAEDIVQETLVAAFEHMAGFEGRSTVKTWLTRILMRRAARCHRRRARKGTVPLGRFMAGGDEVLSSGDGSVSEETARRLDVERALQDLSPDHREVVVLREFQGMSYAEMAEVLEVPQGTVESRLYRARRSLQRALREYLP